MSLFFINDQTMIDEGRVAKEYKVLKIVNNKMEANYEFNMQLLNIMSDFVLIKIVTQNWRIDVTKELAKAIKIFGLFGFQTKIIA